MQHSASPQETAYLLALQEGRLIGQRCPKCGNTQLDKLGDGKTTTQYEYVPGYFIRYEHVQEKRSCRCGGYIVTAEPPARPTDTTCARPGSRLTA